MLIMFIRFYRWLMECEHNLEDRIKHSDLFALPRLRRLFHIKTRKHVFGIGIGVGICCLGSTMALSGAHQTYLPHFLWDCLSYMIHGIGSVPILHHFEPLWAVIIAE